MFNFIKQKKNNETKLYNKMLSLSRNKFFFTNISLSDTFQNRIYLLFIHISFLLIKIKKNNKKGYKIFYQDFFDYTFDQIEINMREIGYGDVSVNKNMKSLVKNFYNILLYCETYINKNFDEKETFFQKYLDHNTDKKTLNSTNLVKYFDKYQTFCFNLNLDSVLKGNLEFDYK